VRRPPRRRTPEEERKVLELRLDRLAGLEVRSDAWVDGAEFSEAPPDGGEGRQGGAIGLVQQRIGLGAEALQPLGIRQHLPRGRQLTVLPGPDVGAADLVPLKGQEIDAGTLLPLVDSQGVELGTDGADPGKSLGNGLPARLQVSVRVEQVEVALRIEQHLVLVLSVQLDESVREFAQRSRRRERIVHEGPAATLCRDLAADDHLAAVDLEDGLNAGGIGARAHQVARRPPAEKEADRLDQDRLARARLASEDVQAGLELDLDLIDDREIADRQVPQHAWRGETGVGERASKTRKCHRNTLLNAHLQHATLARRAVPAAHLLWSGGSFAHVWPSAGTPGAER
jgi:hypothetical protein